MTRLGLTGPATHGKHSLERIDNLILVYMVLIVITLSRVLAVGSKDMITRLYAMKRMVNFGIHSIGSHRDCIVACFFEKDSLDITTISR